MQDPTPPTATLTLSKVCWDCLVVLRDTSYANAYTVFWADQIKLVQQGVRQVLRDIK